MKPLAPVTRTVSSGVASAALEGEITSSGRECQGVAAHPLVQHEQPPDEIAVVVFRPVVGADDPRHDGPIEQLATFELTQLMIELLHLEPLAERHSERLL